MIRLPIKKCDYGFWEENNKIIAAPLGNEINEIKQILQLLKDKGLLDGLEPPTANNEPPTIPHDIIEARKRKMDQEIREWQKAERSPINRITELKNRETGHYVDQIIPKGGIK